MDLKNSLLLVTKKEKEKKRKKKNEKKSRKKEKEKKERKKERAKLSIRSLFTHAHDFMKGVCAVVLCSFSKRLEILIV